MALIIFIKQYNQLNSSLSKFYASITAYLDSFIPVITSSDKNPCGIAVYSTSLTSLPNYTSFSKNLRLSSCKGSWVPIIILVLGNLLKISSLALNGEMRGSINVLNSGLMYDSTHKFKTLWLNT